MSSIEEFLEERAKDLEHEIKKASKKEGRDFGGVVDGLISVRLEGNHVHTLYPKNEEVSQELVGHIVKERGISVPEVVGPPYEPRIVKNEKDEEIKERKIVFRHKRALGDEIMFTAGVRDFKLLFPHIRLNVDGGHPALWENNPYLDRTVKKGEEGVEYYKVGYPMVGNANNTAMHFSTMFLFDMIAMADHYDPLPMSIGEFTSAFANGEVGDPGMYNLEKNPDACEPFISLQAKYKDFCKTFVRQRGDLHMTEEEKLTNMVKEVYGVDKYWVIAPGGKRDCTAKVWDWRKFQKVIDYFEGRIKFVVIGKSDLLVEKLNGVIDLVDKFKDLRGLVSLVYHSEGCISGPSALMHIAAAVPPREYCRTCKKYALNKDKFKLCKCKKPKWSKQRKPCVSIFGGREPTAWSWYCNHQVLHTNAAYSCCDNGGCWKARVYPLQKDPQHNKSDKLCANAVVSDGRTVQSCMEQITAHDVIRAIERYYDGDMYRYMKPSKKIKKKDAAVDVGFDKCRVVSLPKDSGKEINLLGNLNSKGGGEQSLYKIAELLKKEGWKIHLYPWGSVNKKFIGGSLKVEDASFKNGMAKHMRPGLPLLFYANDCVWDFAKSAEEVVNKSSGVAIGINYCNGTLPKSKWLASSRKLKAMIFQNREKRDEFDKDAIGFEETERIVMFGAIDLDKFLEICPDKRNGKNSELVILKHCTPDYRKYVTEESKNSGDKIHIWQKHFSKDPDTKFYKRLLKDTKNTTFMFMEAHKELVKRFKDEKRMVFYKWDEISVTDFLTKGHLYLYRTSNAWRDQYPRGIAEALAAGLPVLCEPRDGPMDRVIYGDTGYYCVDYDQFLDNIKKLQRKEDHRHHMGMNAKDWARVNLDPRKWVDVLDGIFYG